MKEKIMNVINDRPWSITDADIQWTNKTKSEDHQISRETKWSVNSS